MPADCLLLLRLDHIELALRRFQCRACLCVGGQRLLVIGIGLLEALHRRALVLRQRAIAVHVVLAAHDLGRGRDQFGLCLGDDRLLQAALASRLASVACCPATAASAFASAAR